jgi:hypothetical protein
MPTHRTHLPARRNLAHQIDTEQNVLTDYFDRARSIDLLSAQNPAFTTF